MFSSIYNWYYCKPKKYPQDLKIVVDKEARYMMIHPDGQVEFPESYDNETINFSGFSHDKVYLSGEYLTTKNKFHRFPSVPGKVNPFASSLESLCHTRFEQRYSDLITGKVILEWVDPPSEQDIDELNDNYYQWSVVMNKE